LRKNVPGGRRRERHSVANVYHLPRKGYPQDALFAVNKVELRGAKEVIRSFAALTKTRDRIVVALTTNWAIKSCGLISLQDATEQLPWNDILAEKPGGGVRLN
jgi:hypothetical protein